MFGGRCEDLPLVRFVFGQTSGDVDEESTLELHRLRCATEETV